MIRKASQMQGSFRGSSHGSGQSVKEENVILIVACQNISLQEKKERELQSVENFVSIFKGVFATQKCHICYLVVKNCVSLASCGHRFCQKCLLRHLIYKIDSMEKITCPNQGCNRKIDMRSSVYKKLGQNYKQKHKKQQLWKQTLNNPDLKLCPLQKCKLGIVNMKKKPPECQKCMSKFCQECMMKWHQGKPCQQNFKQQFKQMRRCPGCRMFIQKSQGCNHVTCRCGHEYCFVCSQSWSQSHYSCQKFNPMIYQQQFRYPKVLGFLLILLIPFFVLFSVMTIGISIGILIVGQFFGAVIAVLCAYSSIWCFLCVIVMALIFSVIFAVAALIGGMGLFLGTFTVNYFHQHYVKIRGLRHRPNRPHH